MMSCDLESLIARTMLEIHIHSVFVFDFESAKMKALDSQVRVLLESERGNYHLLAKFGLPTGPEEVIMDVEDWIRDSFFKKRRLTRYPVKRELLSD